MATSPKSVEKLPGSLEYNWKVFYDVTTKARPDMKPTRTTVAAAQMLLRREGWLSRTPTEFQDVMLANAHWLEFDAGETISHGGDTDGGIYGLVNGEFSGIPAVGAPELSVIHVFAAPFWYGLNPVLEGRPRSISMVARTPCIVALVPQHALNALLSENPAWWRWIALCLSEILALTSQIAADLMIRDSRRRCLAILLRVAERRTAGDTPAVAQISQDDLASMANLSRQTIGPILRELAQAKNITVGYRSITLHAPATLRALVNA
jgi:CRP/FNR family transcriptional regulator, cyclic AMP receptor protein